MYMKNKYALGERESYQKWVQLIANPDALKELSTEGAVMKVGVTVGGIVKEKVIRSE